MLNAYLTIINLNVNILNFPIKRDRVSEWMKKNKTHQYAAYKNLILDLKTSVVWKWGDGKIFIMQVEVKKSQSHNSYNRKIDFKPNTVMRDE